MQKDSLIIPLIRITFRDVLWVIQSRFEKVKSLNAVAPYLVSFDLCTMVKLLIFIRR